MKHKCLSDVSHWHGNYKGIATKGTGMVHEQSEPRTKPTPLWPEPLPTSWPACITTDISLHQCIIRCLPYPSRHTTEWVGQQQCNCHCQYISQMYIMQPRQKRAGWCQHPRDMRTRPAVYVHMPLQDEHNPSYARMHARAACHICTPRPAPVGVQGLAKRW